MREGREREKRQNIEGLCKYYTIINVKEIGRERAIERGEREMRGSEVRGE